MGFYHFFQDTPLHTILKINGYLLKRVYKSLIVVSLITALWLVVSEAAGFQFSANFSLPGLLGAALGVLLVFRNNSAYERWWEARKILGVMVNTSRSTAMLVIQLAGTTHITRDMIRLVGAFAIALKCHLRDESPFEELNEVLPADILSRLKSWSYVPNAVVNEFNLRAKWLLDQRLISDLQFIELSEKGAALVEITGMCERIKNTPIPVAHKYLLKVYILAYALIVPFGLITAIGWWAILAVVMIYYVTMSIVIISEEIEEPFGTDPNDLPVDRIVANIQKSLHEIYYNNTALEKVDFSANPDLKGWSLPS